MEDEKLYCCNCTSVGYDNEYKLRQHYRRSHPTLKVMCKICFNKFGRDKDLKEHQEEEHAKKDKVLIICCVHCNKSFKYKFGLKSHNARRHSTYKSTCVQCGSAFLDDNDRNKHARKHYVMSVKEDHDYEKEACETDEAEFAHHILDV